MTPSPPSYRRAFWKSRPHLWLAFLTLGLGFATGEPLGLLAGAVAYVLGWVFVPDAGFFRRGVDERAGAAQQQALAAELAAFQQQQERLQAGLSSGRMQKFRELTAVCEDIKSASAEGPTATGLDLSTRWRKLDELRWTYLRMLSVEQSLEVYLETERQEQVPTAVQSLEREIATLTAEVTALERMQPRAASLDGKQRLLTSRLERLAAFNQRLRHIDQARTNHDLLVSEQARLVEQVKLIRADAIASRNPDSLTARIDVSIEHLAATNQWLTELADFRDLTRQIPAGPANHPPLSGVDARSPHQRTHTEQQP